MIIKPQLPGGYVIFCDDVREEVNGKLTFVGVYGGEMTIFGIPPATLPKVCFVTRLRVDPTTLPKTITFKVTKEMKEQTEVLLEATIEAQALPDQFEFPETIGGDGTKFVEIGFNAVSAGLIFTEQSTIRVRAFVDEDELRLGALSVKVAPPPQDSN